LKPPHSHSQACRNPPQHDRHNQRLPLEGEKGGQRANMKERHEYRGIPANTLSFCGNDFRLRSIL
jgi:hypothetical protein